ncbi:MAG: chorismate synthase [Clostridiales bacterium]|jgi:chorismate synthase|nr:chorismate synthase [Clostridiales bacterium]
MPGSIFGSAFKITTWGESHGRAIGVVIDGCPAGLPVSEKDLQRQLDRRRPGSSEFASRRGEIDKAEIMSGVFNGLTSGTPICVVIFNGDARSRDYEKIKDAFRPSHADYGYFSKYGFRDYRGGGRSSGRETAGRVAAGAVAKLMLEKLDITVNAYVVSIGSAEISRDNFNIDDAAKNPLAMPDMDAYERAAALVRGAMSKGDSVGGVVECVITGVPPGLGEPVFDKLDAVIAHAVMSVGAVKGVEFGVGFGAAKKTGLEHNDQLASADGQIKKLSNNAGGVTGGLSDGSDIVFRAAVKPTPSISPPQKTVNESGENIEIKIEGRHDPVIAPRAAVVVESMAALAVADAVLRNASATMNNLTKLYNQKGGS